MANAEHLKLLKQGVEVWNHWREQNPQVKPDLRRADLSHYFREVEIGGREVRANLRGIDLSRADLRGANLSRASLFGAVLFKANLNKANLRGADLRRVDLTRVDLRQADLSQANLIKVDLVEANLTQANLRDANLNQTDLSEANLSEADLSGAKLSAILRGADLSKADLRGANLSEAYLRGANLNGADLIEAILREADLLGASLHGVNLRKSKLNEADLRGVNLSGSDLSEVDLSKANLSGTELRGTNLNGSVLYQTCLHKADLNEADLSEADLSETNLRRVQALGTCFERALFTGACLANWNINSATNFEGAICEYVYLKADQQERRPREGKFNPGEFAALFQQAIDTVDIIFKDGIDWQAFFHSFQELRSQYADQDISIQAIEKKRSGAFVVRLEVPPEVNKAAVEERAKALYGEQLKQIEGRYQQLLQLQGQQLDDYRAQIRQQQSQNSRLLNIVETMAEKDSASKYDLSNAQFAGGFAETVQGDQIGGTINNYGPNTENITRLLNALRDQTQTFPTDPKDDANDALDLLERDLKEEQPDQGRISRRLKKLVALGAAIGTIASGAAAVSGDVSTFTGNVIELTEQLGMPVEQVQLPPSGTP
ncbi:MAG: pentapeptide repeat-containing protein [Cyanobacteria bacterium P01_C01_bin.70]